MIKDGGLFDVIRRDEPSYLIWQWRPDGKKLEKSEKAYSIRWGSALRVKEGSVAVFFYKQKDGTIQEYIEGPFDGFVETKNFPILTNIIGTAYAGKSPFQAEVFFINIAAINQVKFAIPFFEVYDSTYPEMSVPVAVRGSLIYKIADYKEFVRLHRLETFSVEAFTNQIRDLISRYAKSVVENIPLDYAIPVIQIERMIHPANVAIEKDIKEALAQDFGIDLARVDINSIEVDRTSETYKELVSVTKNITIATRKTEAQANIDNIREMQIINVENTRESLKIQREEGQYARHMQTQSQNIDAFKTEKETEVGIEAARSIGEFGRSSSMQSGDGGSGFNPAAMMTSVALGGALTQKITEKFEGAASTTSKNTPPPLPTSQQVMYYAVVNGKQSGPYDINGIMACINARVISNTSLMWKEGMTDWIEANQMPEIASLFVGDKVPPIPPLPNK